jgi:hypothetical protein
MVFGVDQTLTREEYQETCRLKKNRSKCSWGIKYVVLDRLKLIFCLAVRGRECHRLKIEEDDVRHQFPILCFARQKKEEKHGVREEYH